MIEFINNLSSAEQVLWYIALPSTSVFLVMTLLAFIGIDSTEALEADIEVESSSDNTFEFYTLRNLISFLTTFSWTGIVLLKNNIDLFNTIIISVLFGIIVVLLLSSIFYYFSKLQVDYTPDIKQSIGKEATVYLKIPKNGIGQVITSYGGGNRTVKATSKNFDIPTGSRVKIISEASGILTVEPIQ